MPITPRDTRIKLEEEAMAGSDVEARQEAARRRAIKATQVPTAKEIAAMPPKVAERVRDEIKAGVTINLATLPIAIDTAIDNAAKDLDAILAAAEAETAMAEALEFEAAALAATAQAQELEGDTIITKAMEEGIIPYSGMPKIFQQVVNQQPQYTNAGIAAAVAALSAVGVEGLVDIMSQIRELYPDISSEDALMLLKYDKRFNSPYLTRFKGNKMLMDAGFAPIDDKEYLATEAAYNKIFTSYNIKQFANRDKYASLIGNMVSADELANRVSTAYDRVVKGAAETQKALTQLFPELTTSDIVAYALDPVNQLPALQRKVQAAEIGGAALAQNLSIGLTQGPKDVSGYTNVSRQGLGIEQLQAQGVDLEEARRGYAAVAGVLPTAEKLSSIYGDRMKQYGRQEAEQEAFLNLASAKSAREKLTQAEIAQFSGQSGILKSQRRAIGGLI